MAEGRSPLDKLQERELVDGVQKALGELAETDREILLLRLFEGMSNQEVAQTLDLTNEAASKRFGRALVKLRGALKSL